MKKIFKQVIKKFSHSLELNLKQMLRKNGTLEYAKYLPSEKEFEQEIQNLLLQKIPFPMYPYEWTKDYIRKKMGYPGYMGISKNFSIGKGELWFAEYNKMRLYFPDSVWYHSGKNNYDYILHEMSVTGMEMDLLSPHRYVTKENKMWGTMDRNENKIPEEPRFCIEKGDIVLDIGASIGNFARSIVETAGHIYLFESDSSFNKALELTFKDFKDKVTIVNKFISDVDTENSVRLDTFFKNKQVNFIKADLEGSEQKMLNGGKNLFTERTNIKCAITTYHKPEDAQNFKNFFENLDYETKFTNGFLFVPANNNWLHSSFLRKAVIRVFKSEGA
ncbi:MAG: FkbM family methyltransferase [Fibromonadaceae bacterium]|jgi:hypothetical protein|nr:FkbM family methyltransferase [Fibromonadaceae bacterium]